MFDRLTLLEKSKLYAAMAELELKYGKEKTRKALEVMAAELESPDVDLYISGTGIHTGNFFVSGRTDSGDMYIKPQEDPEQLMLPFDSEPEPEENVLDREGEKKRNFNGRQPNGINDKKIDAYFESVKQFHPGILSSQELLVKMYYVSGLNQYQIADKVGVNQRAISKRLQGISDKRKQAIIRRWKEGEQVGH